MFEKEAEEYYNGQYDAWLEGEEGYALEEEVEQAFKNYMCNKFQVKNVDDIDMSIKEYADLMEVFEAGYMAKEKEIIDRILNEAERTENDPDKLTDDVMNDWKEMEDKE